MYALIILLFLNGPILQGQLSVETTGLNANIVLENVTAFFAFEFEIQFDPNILEAVLVSPGGEWESYYLWHAGEIKAGTIGFTSGAAIWNNAPLGVDVEVLVIANIQFKVKGIGDSQIALANVLLCDLNGDEIIPVINNGVMRVVIENRFIKPVPKH